jgi:hypothetical protein
MERTALILVGRALAQEGFEESRLYAADYDRRFRAGRAEAVQFDYKTPGKANQDKSNPDRGKP